jgi:hypothetical protein
MRAGPRGVSIMKGTVAPVRPWEATNWRTISTFIQSSSPSSREGSECATRRPRPSTTYTSKRPPWPISRVMLHSRPRLATASTTPITCSPERTGSASAITGSCSEREKMGWLTMGRPCSPRSTPSCSSCSMAGSLSWMPERAPEPVASTTLIELSGLAPPT